MTRARSQEALRQKRRHLQLHRRIFAGCAVAATLVVFAMEGGGRFVWPLFVWGFALFLHFLYVRSLNVDDNWASNRAADVAQHAYDSGHIDIIRKRYEDSVPSQNPRDAKKP